MFKKECNHLFDNLYLYYCNFFVALKTVIVNCPICKDNFLSEKVISLGMSLRTLTANKNGWSESFRFCILWFSQNSSNKPNTANLLGSSNWRNFILNTSYMFVRFICKIYLSLENSIVDTTQKNGCLNEASA